MARYQAVVDELEQTVDAIPHHQWHSPLEPEGWNLHQVLVHLRDSDAHAYLPRILRMLAEDTPYVEDFDAEAWMLDHYNPEEPVSAILAEFRDLREREIACLESMPPEGWGRMGRHPSYGLRSIQWWAERSLEHAEEHLKQLKGSHLAGE